MRLFIFPASITIVAISILSACSSEERQAAEVFCFQNAAIWASNGMTENFISNKPQFVFSERTDAILLTPFEPTSSDSYTNKEVAHKKQYLEKLKAFSKAEPKYFEECKTVTFKILKECKGVSNTNECFSFHKPKIDDLEQKYNKIAQRKAEMQKRQEKLYAFIIKDDIEGFKSEFNVKSLTQSAEDQRMLSQIIGNAIDNGAVKIASIWIKKDTPELLKAVIQRLANSSGKNWTEGQKKSIAFIRPLLTKSLVNKAISLEQAESLVENDASEKLATFIDMGLNVKRKNKYNQDLAILATKDANIDVLKVLLQKSISVEHTDRLGRSLLHIAVDDRNVELTKFFRQNGANPNRKKYDSFGDSAIAEATKSGNEELIKALK